MVVVSDALPAEPGFEGWCATRRSHRLVRRLGRVVDRLSGVAELMRLYRSMPRNAPFWDGALAALGVRFTVIRGDPGGIPRIGPLVIVANHPFGGLDGLILLALLARVRGDVKFLGNYLLGRLPELSDILIPTDPFGETDRRGMNASAGRAAIRWLESGGALAAFPAGAVARSRLDGGDAVDAEWMPGVARLVRRGRADVQPIFLHGCNSRFFYGAARLHPLAGTALLPRQLLNKRDRQIRVSIGACIPRTRLDRLDSPEEIIAYCRMRTDALADPGSTAAPQEASRPAAIARPEPPDAVEREIQALDPSHLLVRSGAFDVLCARSQQIPRALLDIGRLREAAFRASGEGSGGNRDIDRFDSTYLHLFAWNRNAREIAGAYRIGPADEIVPRLGIAGLYTSTLFDFDERLLNQIMPALELGRAFVAQRYQRDYNALLLLWRGIAAFVCNNPRYRMLFGPVSISNSYHSLSREILARFLYATSFAGEYGALVAARNPPAFLRGRSPCVAVPGAIVRTLADVGTVLAEIEADQKGVPVLVRQYLKLNARLLGFNVDPAFGNALDGLMLVDLTEVDRRILTRYMGSGRAETYLSFHRVRTREAS